MRNPSIAPRVPTTKDHSMLNSKRFTVTPVRHLARSVALCFCLCASLASMAQAQSATDLALLKSTAPDRAAKLAAAAKLEGGITLYTSN